MAKNSAIILAGGSGSRFGGEEPKQFANLTGKPIIEHTLDLFEHHPDIHSIYIVSNSDFVYKCKTIVRNKKYGKVKKTLPGGETRQDSSCIGVEAVDEDVENVLIHDVVRPLVGEKLINQILNKMNSFSAVTVAVSSSDTIVEVNRDSIIQSVPERQGLMRVQTPQAFKLELIKKAHSLAKEKNIRGSSDDCSLIVHFGLADIFVIAGSTENLKITHPRDIIVAEQIIKLKNRETQPS